tara:strand:+ start:80 stop:853 length:774 start_codon:yes stop_codon:yes gene_type:complete
MIKIEPIKAFNDNYIWLVTTNEGLLVVDPGDAQPVMNYLNEIQGSLSDILITHHHYDHTGGVEALAEISATKVYGPSESIFGGITHELKEGDTINVIGIEFSVLEIPGHTLDHIAYYAKNNGEPFVFCGDTLFAGGCGRVFEGTYEQMYESLIKLKQLPSNTKVYCGHEYTKANLEFALEVESSNKKLLARFKSCLESNKINEPTVPSLLELELETNPFLRSDNTNLRECIMTKISTKNELTDMEIFKATREWKDNV